MEPNKYKFMRERGYTWARLTANGLLERFVGLKTKLVGFDSQAAVMKRSCVGIHKGEGL